MKEYIRTKIETNSCHIKWTLLAGLVSILLTIFGDWLFVDHPIGWTSGLFGIAVLIAVLLNRPSVRIPKSITTFLIIGYLLLCARCIYAPNAMVLLFIVLGILTLAMAHHEGWHTNTVLWIQRLSATLTYGWVSMARSLAHGILCTVAKSSQKVWTKRLHLWGIPLALGAMFILLFAMANPLISQALKSCFTMMPSISIPDTFLLHVFFWILIFPFLGLLLGSVTNTTLSKGPVDERDNSADTPLKIYQLIPADMTRRALLLFNAIFMIQTILDTIYLWGGSALPRGMTYAQYAHRGAYPLIVAALLAGAFVLAAFPPEKGKTSNKTNRLLVYLWLGQTLMLVVSSGWRLWLYIDTYALSRLRFVSGIWMLLVAFGLITILIRIAQNRSSKWLINTNTLVTLIVLYACALAGMDTHIANFNVHQYEKQLGSGNEGLDVEYLKTLGPEALPALHRIVGKCDGYPKADKIREAVYVLEKTVETQMSEWRGWTIQNALLHKRRHKYIESESWIDLNEMEGGRMSILDNETETDMTKLHESHSVPEIANDTCDVAEDSFTFGKVVGTTSNTLTISEYDFTIDAFKQVEFIVTSKTELENIDALSDLKPGDDVIMDYSVDGNKLIMTTLVLEVPGPIPAKVSPRVDMPPADIIDLVFTGRVLSLIPGCINIEEQYGINNTPTNRSYQISRTAKLHGYNSLSDLQRDQLISYHTLAVEGQLSTIIELAAPGHTITNRTNINIQHCPKEEYPDSN